MRMIHQTHYILLALAALFMAACSQEEEPQEVKEPPILKVLVGKDAASETRATVSSYTTTFSEGDKIGIFAVKEDASGRYALYMNVPYVLNNNEWKLADPDTKVYFSEKYTYFAYYPYQEIFDGIDSDQSDPDEFFSQEIDNWAPLEDQSTLSNYNASDLMVSLGDVNRANASVSFMLHHTMGLVEISLSDPQKVQIDDISSFDSSEYFFLAEQNMEAPVPVPVPYNNGNTFFYIAKPGQEITFYFNENQQTVIQYCTPVTNGVKFLDFTVNQN